MIIFQFLRPTGSFLFIIYFIIIVVIPPIIGVRLVKKAKHGNLKIFMGCSALVFSYLAILGWYVFKGLLPTIPDTKQCPYCGEKILLTAEKCKHCGEWLNNR